MIIRPSYLKASIPFIVAMAIWILALLIPPFPSTSILTLGIILPSIIPIGILLLLINTKIILTDDGIFMLKTFNIKRHIFNKEDVHSVKEDFLFRNVKGGLGAGKSLYIKYQTPDSKSKKEFNIAFSIYNKNDIERIKHFLD